MIITLKPCFMNSSKLLWLCIFLGITPSLFARDTLTYHLKGQLQAYQTRIPVYSGFKVPDNAFRIEVTQRFRASDQKKCNIDIGIFDEKGCGLNSPGFRGWSGGSRRFFFIDADTATPGYLPGPIQAGEWHVIQMLTSKNPQIDWELDIKVICDSKWKKKRDKMPVYKGIRAAEKLTPRDGKPRSRYYKIDTHVHSVHSDGKWSLAELVQLGKKNGLDGIVSCDHNTLSTQKEWGKVQDSAFLVLNGMEVTYAQGHWNVIHIAPDHWVDFRVHVNDLPSFKLVLNQARKGRGMAFANHPGAIRFLYDASLMDGVEVWNGTWNEANEKSLALWQGLLCACKHSVALAASDLHNAKNLGMPCSAVWAEEMSQEAVAEGIRKGQLYLAKDPTVQMSVQAVYSRNPETKFSMGESILREDNIVLEFQCNRGGKLHLIDETGTYAQKEVEASASYAFNVPNSAHFVRVELRDAENKMIAMSNPFYMVPLSTHFPLIPKP